MESLDIKTHEHKNIPPGSVITMIGTRGSGKSEAVKSICYHFRQIPRFVVVSKTEKNNQFFGNFVPKDWIYYDWDYKLLPRIF